MKKIAIVSLALIANISASSQLSRHQKNNMAAINTQNLIAYTKAIDLAQLEGKTSASYLLTNSNNQIEKRTVLLRDVLNPTYFSNVIDPFIQSSIEPLDKRLDILTRTAREIAKRAELMQQEENGKIALLVVNPECKFEVTEKAERQVEQFSELLQQIQKEVIDSALNLLKTIPQPVTPIDVSMPVVNCNQTRATKRQYKKTTGISLEPFEKQEVDWINRKKREAVGLLITNSTNNHKMLSENLRQLHKNKEVLEKNKAIMYYNHLTINKAAPSNMAKAALAIFQKIPQNEKDERAAWKATQKKYLVDAFPKPDVDSIKKNKADEFESQKKRDFLALYNAENDARGEIIYRETQAYLRLLKAIQIGGVIDDKSADAGGMPEQAVITPAIEHIVYDFSNYEVTLDESVLRPLRSNIIAAFEKLRFGSTPAKYRPGTFSTTINSISYQVHHCTLNNAYRIYYAIIPKTNYTPSQYVVLSISNHNTKFEGKLFNLERAKIVNFSEE